MQQFYKIYKLNPANKSKKEKTIQNFPLWTVTIFDRFLSFFRHKAETHEKIVAKVAAHQTGTAERESPSVLHRFKDDVQDVLDYLDDEPIPTCNAGFFEYDLAEWSKSPKYYDNQLESLCSDAVKSEIELINVIEK